METQESLSFLQVLLIAAIPSVITGIISYLLFYQQLMAFKRDSMAERAAKHLLKHKGYTNRKFETIKKHLGGWDNDEDELRRILVRAGAIRAINEGTDKTEQWYLLSRTKERVNKMRQKHNKK